MPSKRFTAYTGAAVTLLAMFAAGWWLGNRHKPDDVDDVANRLRDAVKDDPRAAVLAEATIARRDDTLARVNSGARLRELGRVLKTFASSHGGDTPKKPQDLSGTPGFAPTLMQSPRPGCNYTYVGFTKDDPADHVVVYETGDTNGFVMMLLKSGKAEGCWGAARIQKSIDTGIFVSEEK